MPFNEILFLFFQFRFYSASCRVLWKSIQMHTHELNGSQILHWCVLQWSHRIWWMRFSLCRWVSCGELGRTIIIITASWQCPEWSIPAAAVCKELCNPQQEPSVHQDKPAVKSWDRLLFTVQYGHTHTYQFHKCKASGYS